MGSVSTIELTYKYTPVKGVPRPAWTYRAARRNKAFRPDDGVGVIWNGAATTYYRRPPVRANKRDRSKDKL